jgi:PilZ domain
MEHDSNKDAPAKEAATNSPPNPAPAGNDGSPSSPKEESAPTGASASKDAAATKEAPSRSQPRPRRFNRYRYDVRIDVAVFRNGETTRFWGRTNEVGQDGLGATLTGELKAGEVVSVEFPIPIAPLVMKVRAIVRYSEGLRCGFEFLVVTSDQRETMRRLCEALANAS